MRTAGLNRGKEKRQAGLEREGGRVSYIRRPVRIVFELRIPSYIYRYRYPAWVSKSLLTLVLLLGCSLTFILRYNIISYRSLT